MAVVTAPTARVRAATPLLAVEQSTTHGPTRALLDALRRNGWRVLTRPGATSALLSHLTYGTIEVRVDPDDTERLTPFVDGRQVSFKYAMRHAIGEI